MTLEEYNDRSSFDKFGSNDRGVFFSDMSQNQRFLFVRNLPYKATPEELYELFGKFGGVRQIRQGNAQDTRYVRVPCLP